jgi:hypothetical protein
MNNSKSYIVFYNLYIFFIFLLIVFIIVNYMNIAILYYSKEVFAISFDNIAKLSLNEILETTLLFASFLVGLSRTSYVLRSISCSIFPIIFIYRFSESIIRTENAAIMAMIKSFPKDMLNLSIALIFTIIGLTLSVWNARLAFRR